MFEDENEEEQGCRTVDDGCDGCCEREKKDEPEGNRRRLAGDY